MPRGAAGVRGWSVSLSAGGAAPDGTVTGERRATRIGLPLAIGLIALLGRLLPVLRGGGLFGRESYDPFVYYSAAVSLWSGRLPYRDFLLLHPPGMLVALLPFAGLGALAGDPVGMAAARLAIMLTGAGSAVLVYLLLRPGGMAGALVGAGLYAVWFPAYYTEHDVRLEAVAGFLVLSGIAVLQLWRTPRSNLPPLLAGALFAAATMVKLWGVVGIVVLVVWLCWHHGPRRAAMAVAGAALAAAQLVLPFATVMPQFLQLAVTDQLGRTPSGTPAAARLLDILGLGPAPPPLATPLLAVAVVLTVTALWIAFRTPQGRLHGLLVLSGVAVLLAAPSWYPHYPALVAGPLCLVLGNAAAVLLAKLSRPMVRRAALGVVVTGVAGALVLLLGHTAGMRFPGQELAAVLSSRPGCVTTDRPAALVLSNLLRRNLERGCPVVVDPLGYKFAAQHAGLSRRENRRQFRRFLTDYLGSGTSAVLVTTQPEDLGPANAARIATWPVIGKAGRYLVREPVPAAPGKAWQEALETLHPRPAARYP